MGFALHNAEAAKDVCDYTTRHDVHVLQIVYFEQLLEVSSC